ncbi:nitroreductase family protein [Temperatibacter marinus]|uniref:Nitroreductase family protein n=1 Tax=Temperatibacter marinus TaxID=1456591 RepID=A0AA52H9Z0_9PROT|nr:nitroreductase family protein [Temperatibacter marinus]WND03052.1 nitroreductase family protein [Temperatibacter marinus]
MQRKDAPFAPLSPLPSYTDEERIERSKEFFQLMASRRTVRDFTDQPVPKEIIENAILAAGRAPSGANKQPWHFVAISKADIKAKLREAAEEEEREFYGGRASEEWLDDLVPFGTDEHKPFLETAPWLIAVFRQSYGLDEDTGEKETHYYVHESVGLAAGMLITSLHNSGLATLTHTPSPMGFLNMICGRPKHEKPIMLVVAGHPTKDAEVPVINKKPLDQISTFIS